MDWDKKVYPIDIWKWIKGWSIWSGFKSIVNGFSSFNIMPNTKSKISRKMVFKRIYGGNKPNPDDFFDTHDVFSTKDNDFIWTINGVKRKPTTSERIQFNRSLDRGMRSLDKAMEELDRKMKDWNL